MPGGNRPRPRVDGSVAGLLSPRFTASGRLKDFPTALSAARIGVLREGGAAAVAFDADFGPVAALDSTDGLLITFSNGEIVHQGPSGNAPELRCYNEADCPGRAATMNRRCLELHAAWR